MGACGGLWGPMGAYGDLWGSMGTYWGLWGPMGAYGGLWGPIGAYGGLCVPFVNRPFESEIHGTVNFTYFCCFLLVTWCHCVLLSCYLRPK